MNAIRTARAACELGAQAGHPADRAVYAAGAAALGAVLAVADRCVACGATDDLVAETRYVGGRGYVARVACRHLPSCFGRQDKQNAGPVTDPASLNEE